MDKTLLSAQPHPFAKTIVEEAIFGSRWLLAPFYVGLALSLVVLLVKFAEKTGKLLSTVLQSETYSIIPNILSLIDLSLIGNLLVMVMFAGYENFVSRFELTSHRYKPAWMGHIDLSDLKLKLLTSIIAIAAIHVLELFMHLSDASDRELGWSVGILMALVVAGVLLAVMKRITGAEDV